MLAGDLFDLPSEMPNVARDRALASALDAQPHVRAAFAEHVDRGGELRLISGNHDAEVGAPDFRDALARAFGISSSRARLRTTPWFFREGGVHIEHGHLYDPDNAPAHPLILGARSLGTHFVEELIAPTGAHRYLNANDQTPPAARLRLRLVRRPRPLRGLPLLPRRAHRDGRERPVLPRARRARARQAARARLRRRARRAARGDRRPVARAAIPTMASFQHTFARVHFDRVLATLSILGGVGCALAGSKRAAALAVTAGAALMSASWARGHDRYAGTVNDRLREGAAAVRSVTGARLVLFGHTHREALEPGYANTGSFAFHRDAPGRPFLEIEDAHTSPRAIRRHWPATS
ncbi:MAG: hypothetical protein R3F14_14055 [Polyangiaceae bacterium]